VNSREFRREEKKDLSDRPTFNALFSIFQQNKTTGLARPGPTNSGDLLHHGTGRLSDEYAGYLEPEKSLSRQQVYSGFQQEK
ncbi:hypothetical protein ACHY48_21235, partial [Pantoea agglomerans]|uniref:hypothetical protein n=1 Tax=Enterobacter agglomerans TaxID=549 RepID=UPI00387F0E0D